MTVHELVTTKVHANGAEMMRQTEGLAVLAAFLAKTTEITSWVHLPTGAYVTTGVMKRYETRRIGAAVVVESEIADGLSKDELQIMTIFHKGLSNTGTMSEQQRTSTI